MQFSCEKAQLLELSEAVCRVTPATSSDESHLRVLLNVGKGRLKMTGTNGQVWGYHQVPVQQQAPGEVCLSGKLLLGVVKELQTSRADVVTVSMASGNNQLVVDSGDAVYDLAVIWDGAFPDELDMIPTVDFTVPAAVLAGQMRQAKIARGGEYDEVRIESVDGLVTMVSTDSVRLAIRTARVADGTVPNFEATIPGGALDHLIRCATAAGDVRVALDETTVAFTAGHTEIRCRLSDRPFPNWRNIVPKEHARVVTVRTADLLDAVKGVVPISQSDRKAVTVNFERDKVVVSAAFPTMGSARREIEAKMDGDQGQLRFQGAYLLDFLKVADCQRVRWLTGAPSYPAVLEPDVESPNFTYIHMPISTLVMSANPTES